MHCPSHKSLSGAHLRFVIAWLASMALVAPLMLTIAPRAAESADDDLRVLQADANGVVFALSVPSYQLSQRTINGVTFDVLSAPNTEPSADRPGAPQLPMRGVLIAVPQSAEVSVRVIAQQAEELPRRLHLLPIPAAQIERKGLDTQSYVNKGLVYSKNETLYARDGFEPETPVRLGTVGFMRSQRFAQIALFPFQYNAAQQRARWLKQLTVEVRFAYPGGASAEAIGASHDEGPFEAVLQSRLLNYASARAWRAPQKPAPRPASPISAPGDYKIAVKQPGIYRLTYAALTAAGVPTAIDPRTFKIRKNGIELPIYVSGESDGIFDATDYIEFYAQGINTTYSDVNIYWLSYGGANGARLATRSVPPNGATTPSAFRDRAHVEDNHFYVTNRPLGNGDHWYWHAVVAGLTPSPPLSVASPASYAFTLNDPDMATTATLRANVFGAAGAVGASVPHHQQIAINGNLVMDDAWVGEIARQTENSFAASYLLAGANTISLALPNDTGLGYDALFVNWFEVDYDHLYVARNDQLAFAADQSGTFQFDVSNFSNSALALYDVTNPASPARLTNFAVVNNGASFTLRFGENLSAPARYVAFAAGAARTPLSIARDASSSDWRSSANGADEIVITADEFYTATAPLASFRTAQGLRVARVRISDVYDEFSDGVFDPNAIRAFLAYTYTNWQPPAPLYVLLVGDGNLNYRNYQPNNVGAVEPQYIPPYLDAVDPFVNETATDNRFVNIVGSDLAPDMAIGRLPVRSAAEATAAINKIIAFEQNASPMDDWRKRVDFFTDNYYTASGGTDLAGDFYSTAEGILANIPGLYSVTRAYYDPAPVPPNPGYPWHYTTIEAERNALLNALNAGALFANYVGHAATYQWADEAIFSNEGALPDNPDLFSQLANGSRTPIVLELTCRTGNFHFPGTNTLAESFIRAAGRGAVADWASTGLGVNSGHDRLGKEFYQATFTTDLQTLGLIVNASKTKLVADGAYLDLVDEFTLFGDPAMKIGARRAFYLPLITK